MLSVDNFNKIAIEEVITICERLGVSLTINNGVVTGINANA